MIKFLTHPYWKEFLFPEHMVRLCCEKVIQDFARAHENNDGYIVYFTYTWVDGY